MVESGVARLWLWRQRLVVSVLVGVLPTAAACLAGSEGRSDSESFQQAEVVTLQQGAVTSVPACQQYLQAAATRAQQESKRRVRKALERSLRAQRFTMARLAENPATRDGLRQHCRSLSRRLR